MKILKNKIISFLLIFIFLLSSCASKNKKESEKEENSTKKSEITTAIKKQKYNLDPRYSDSIENDAVVSQIYEGLTEYSSSGKISLNEAEDIEKSDDFKEWKITLRDNLKWSNGEKITAKDYISSWISILDKENKNPNYFKLFFIKNAKNFYDKKVSVNDLAIKALDEKTIEVKMEYPVKNFDEFLSNVFMFPVKLTEDSTKFISNSAFNLKEITDEKIILEKNNEYWDAVNTHINTINLKFVENKILAYQLFELGQIDFFGLPFYEIPYERRVDASKKPECLNFKTNIFEFLSLDLKNEILKHKDIRELLDNFIDSNFLANYILYNNSSPIIKREKITSDVTKKLKEKFESKRNEINKNELKLSLNYKDVKLKERILASISKEWLDKYNIKINLQNDLSDINYQTFNFGTTDPLDIKYYINHIYQEDDFKKMYTNIEDIKNDYFIFPIFNRSFSILVNNKIQGLFVSPNGKLLIKNIIKNK